MRGRSLELVTGAVRLFDSVSWRIIFKGKRRRRRGGSMVAHLTANQ
jgi:hypothetical protein